MGTSQISYLYLNRRTKQSENKHESKELEMRGNYTNDRVAELSYVSLLLLLLILRLHRRRRLSDSAFCVDMCFRKLRFVQFGQPDESKRQRASESSKSNEILSFQRWCLTIIGLRFLSACARLSKILNRFWNSLRSLKKIDATHESDTRDRRCTSVSIFFVKLDHGHAVPWQMICFTTHKSTGVLGYENNVVFWNNIFHSVRLGSIVRKYCDLSNANTPA